MLTKFIQALSLVLPVLMLMSFTARADQGTCTGTSVKEDYLTGGIICHGACVPATDLCKPFYGTGLTNEHQDDDHSYEYCSCGGAAEPSCCHLVAVVFWSSWSGTHYYGPGTVGACTVCPLTGKCKLESGQAVCR